MAILNLRSEEPVSEPPEEIGTDETPPGLDAIRAWLRKPRPWLHGIRLWIRWIARRLRRAGKWTAENALPAARRASRLASRGAEAARRVARSATTAAQVGRRLADIGKIWRDFGGRTGAVGVKLANVAGRFRDFSTRVVRTASHGAAIGEGISDFGRVLGDWRERDPSPADEQPRSEPARSLPPPRRPQRREALPEPSPDPPEAGGQERPPTAPPAGRPRRVEAPVTPASTPPRISEKRAAALDKLPWPLADRIRALRPKTRKPVLWPLIVDIIQERGWTTSAELALLLGVGHRNLARRHLGPMVEAGVLALRHPELVSHRSQAYRVNAGPDAES